MDEQRYLISDAAKIVEVEAHVLRYWEEELELPIGRTELGHRYYTRENIETFLKVKELKEKGLQLKAVKTILKGLEKYQTLHQAETRDLEDIREVHEEKQTEKTADAPASKSVKRETKERIAEAADETVRETEGTLKENRKQPAESDEKSMQEEATEKGSQELQVLQENTEKLKHFEYLVEGIVERVVKENNETLEKHIEVTFSREMDYLLHMQEQREEERYRKLDESIRQHQNRQMVAAAKENGLLGRLKRYRKK